MQFYMPIYFKSASYPLWQGEESSFVNYRSRCGGSFPTKDWAALQFLKFYAEIWNAY